MRDFSSLLIANRGEIALRILRTARRMGYRVVTVYSDADADAPHVHQADQSVRIGTSEPQASYLNIASILAAAQQAQADAIHPGYGFLAENADFAQAVVDAGLLWIGPDAAAIRAMGDKARAKRRMASAGVPCIPGYDGASQDDATLQAEAERIGYPLMVKATAGGGGRGMRLVAGSAQLGEALTSARAQARSAFGSETLLLERAIHAPRHVEIQVFADGHGHVVFLGERDCSVQRRHQKLVEEAPSPALHGEAGKALRRAMGAMAVAATRAIDYRGAGTVECLLDTQGDFYFMEMNTRLQVEHPVTEALTAYDLVEWQLRVARGEPLPELDQEVILRRFESGGHAIEARLCAEDPDRDFLPQSGAVLAWQAADTVRVDHALQAGQTVSPFYDSMLAKFIAHAADRDTARQDLTRALRSSCVLGVQTNQALLAATLQHPVFARGQATTDFMAAHGPALRAQTPALPVAMAALVLYAARGWQLGHDPTTQRLPLPWPMPMRLSIDEQPHRAAILCVAGDRYQVTCDGVDTTLRLLACTAQHMTVESEQGRWQLFWAQGSDDLIFASTGGRQTCLRDLSLTGAVHAAQDPLDGQIRAPMAGRLLAVHVRPGQTVRKGEVLLVLEAMKMEHALPAPMDATVSTTCFAAGAQVRAGERLMELQAMPAITQSPGPA